MFHNFKLHNIRETRGAGHTATNQPTVEYSAMDSTGVEAIRGTLRFSCHRPNVPKLGGGTKKLDAPMFFGDAANLQISTSHHPGLVVGHPIEHTKMSSSRYEACHACHAISKPPIGGIGAG